MEFIPSALIVVLCYAIGVILKTMFKKHDSDPQLIPTVLMFVGAVAAVIVFNIQPDYLGVSNPVEAVYLGMVSGFASTGAHQLLKKYLPKDTSSTEE